MWSTSACVNSFSPWPCVGFCAEAWAGACVSVACELLPPSIEISLSAACAASPSAKSWRSILKRLSFMVFMVPFLSSVYRPSAIPSLPATFGLFVCSLRDQRKENVASENAASMQKPPEIDQITGSTMPSFAEFLQNAPKQRKPKHRPRRNKASRRHDHTVRPEHIKRNQCNRHAFHPFPHQKTAMLALGGSVGRI